jgi:protein-disulfide isomerase
MGDPNAPVVIEDFSDFQCSHCRDFFQTTEAYIIENYIATGKVYFIYHSFGSSEGDSGRAAKAAYCAGDQNMFWEMHDIIYTNFSGANSGGYSNNRLIEMAEMIELEDIEIFEDCLKADKYDDKVVDDAKLGNDRGVTGTPTFFINDQIITGNEPLENFKRVIDAELAKVGE